MKSKKKFIETIVEISPVNFSAYDLTKNMVAYTSGLAEKILGYDKETLINFSKDHFKEVIHPEDWSTVEANWERLGSMAENEMIEQIFRVKKVTGEYIWVSVRNRVFERDENGVPTKVAGVGQEVTDLIELQLDLKDKVEQLKSISYLHAHEIRQPVANILGLLELIDEKKYTNELDRRIIEHLKHTVLKLDEVIKQIVRSGTRF